MAQERRQEPIATGQKGVTFERIYVPGPDSQERCVAALLAVLRAPRRVAPQSDDAVDLGQEEVGQ